MGATCVLEASLVLLPLGECCASRDRGAAMMDMTISCKALWLGLIVFVWDLGRVDEGIGVTFVLEANPVLLPLSGLQSPLAWPILFVL